MKNIHYADIEKNEINNDVAKGLTGRVAIGKADGASNFCMRVFEIAQGGHTPVHTHDWEHEIFFHKGKGEVFFMDSWHEVSEGHVFFIPGNIEHQIRNTGDDKLVFVCLVPESAPEI